MTEQNGLELSRRKVLAGIGGIGVAAAGAGFGTSAYFNDGEVFEENTITAGELDLRIDWQQLYYGPEANTDNYAPYGPAGKPFVNAHPDHDMDGEQSLAVDDHDYRYSDDDANIQDVLDCDTLENSDQMSFDTEYRERDRLIELRDLKPGDCGEVTFSLHLCDNPGYIWWLGEASEYTEELAKAITVKAWYDIECTNEFDEEDGDRVLVASTTLKEFLDEGLSPAGRFLNPTVYGAGVGGDDALDGAVETHTNELDKIEFEKDGAKMDGDGEILEIDQDENGNLRIVALFRSPDGTQLIVEFSNLFVKNDDDDEIVATNRHDDDLDEIVQYDWKILDEFDGETSSDAPGMGAKRIKSSNETIEDDLVTSNGCTRNQDEVRTPSTNNMGIPQGISFVEFEYCEQERPPLCFPENETFCVAFEWCFPKTCPPHVDDINELQGESIDFDLGFYTEQCRHNGEPDGPPGFSD